MGSTKTLDTRAPVSRAQENDGHVGIPRGVDAFWVELLSRSGVPLRAADDARDLAGSNIVFAAGRDAADDDAVVSALIAARAGGVPMVLDATCATAVIGHPSIPVPAAVGVTGSGPLFEGAEAVRMPIPIRAPTSAVFGRVRPGHAGAALIDRSGPAPVVVLALPEAADIDRAGAEWNWFDVDRDRQVGEFVSACDVGGLRRLVENALRLAANRAGRPWLRLAHAPDGRSGCLAVRVDADSYDGDATRATLDGLQRAGLRSTWFIDVERHARLGGVESIPDLAADGHEVQSHSWHHFTWPTRFANRVNLARARRVLRTWGVDATAVVAPFGSWNPGFAAALRELGIPWSSEFSRSYDDVPGSAEPRCLRHGLLSEPPWQVPAHPICPKALLDAGCTREAVVAYFDHVVRKAMGRGEPAVLYGHPIDDFARTPDLFRHVAELVREHESENGPLWQPTLGELFGFYRARRRQHVDARVDGQRIVGTVRGPAWLELWTPDGTRRVVTGKFDVGFRATVAPSRAHGPGKEPPGWRRAERRRAARRGWRIRAGRWKREITTSLGRRMRNGDIG